VHPEYCYASDLDAAFNRLQGAGFHRMRFVEGAPDTYHVVYERPSL
jgi:hypothetical protein